MRQRMRALPDADNITIAYPDEGAWKRFHYQFGDYPEASLIPLPLPMDQWCKPILGPVGRAVLSGMCNTITVYICACFSCMSADALTCSLAPPES